ncbi:MAG: hypothetical protein ACP6IU_01335 [Candidatus Asgardarchaeia archaeon]
MLVTGDALPILLTSLRFALFHASGYYLDLGITTVENFSLDEVGYFVS